MLAWLLSLSLVAAAEGDDLASRGDAATAEGAPPAALAPVDDLPDPELLREARRTGRIILWSGVGLTAVGGALTGSAFAARDTTRTNLLVSGAVIGGAGVLAIGIGGLTEAGRLQMVGVDAPRWPATVGLSMVMVGGLVYAVSAPATVGGGEAPLEGTRGALTWTAIGLASGGAALAAFQPLVNEVAVGRTTRLTVRLAPAGTGIALTGTF